MYIKNGITRIYLQYSNISGFKKWFGDWESDPETASKVIDENGEPLVVYHGTKRGMFADRFNTFEGNGKPIWHSSSEEYAKLYFSEKKWNERGDIYTDFLNIKNPVDVGNVEFGGTGSVKWLAEILGVPFKEVAEIFGVKEKDETKASLPYLYLYEAVNSPEFIKWAQNKGYDGIIEVESGNNTYGVFNPNQIKSAVANNGNYDINNPNIYHQIDGRSFSVENNKEREIQRQIAAADELLNSEPILNITDNPLEGLDKNGLRDFFRSKYQTNIEDEKIPQPDYEYTRDNVKVYITIGGTFKEIIHHSADKRIIRLLPYLKEIIKGSIFLFDELPKKSRIKKLNKNTKFYKQYGCKLTIDGEPILVRSTLRVADNGTYYYDVNIDNYKLKKKGPSTSSPENKSGAEVENPSISAYILSNWLEKIKEQKFGKELNSNNSPLEDGTFNQGIKGSLTPMDNGQRIITLFESADESTFMHEMGHLFLLDLEELAKIDEQSAKELAEVTKWAAYKKSDVKGYKGSPFESEFLKLAADIEAAEKAGDVATADKLKRRWMDDRIIIHNDKEFLKNLLNEIRDLAKDLGIFINEKKTQIIKLSHGFTFLKTKYILTKSGKVIRRIPGDVVIRQRRKMKKLARFVVNDEMTVEDFTIQYKSWRGDKRKYATILAVAIKRELYGER